MGLLVTLLPVTIHVREKVPIPTRQLSVVAVVLALALCGLALTAPVAHADPVGDVYSVASTTKAADFIQDHASDVSTGVVGSGVAAGFCGVGAPGCAALVGLAAGSYYQYSGAIQRAARHAECLAVYFGETAGGGVSGAPYVGGYSGPGCNRSGGPTEMTDDIVRSVLHGRGG